MSGAVVRETREHGAPPVGLPRLLDGLAPNGAPVGLAEHLEHLGIVPLRAVRRPSDVITELERAGLRGRGGAGFPTAVKWRAVATGRRRPAVVVANGAEAEPASRKDRVLLARAPHLVLDGAALAAAVVRASRAVVYVPAEVLATVSAAAAERQAHGIDPVPIEVMEAASSFLAGEESAVVAHVNRGPGGVPTFTRLRPVYERGVGGRATLVQNVETLAHAGLIARFGADWFRSVGTDASPGTALLSVSSPQREPVVVEVALGTPVRSAVAAAGIDPSGIGAVLLGGYGGAWAVAPDILGVPLEEESLRAAGATLGAGVVVALAVSACPLAETARLAGYMASQSAGQCGPCVNGLPALAETMAALAWRPEAGGEGLVRRVHQLGQQVAGRGACNHPDGTVRMVRSALRVFSRHVESHLRQGSCPAATGPALLAVPGARHGRVR